MPAVCSRLRRLALGYHPGSYWQVDGRAPVNAAVRTATLHGNELSYLDTRDSGPALLFIHGLLGSRRSWRHLVDTLDPEFRVLAPDLFGHGASAKPMGDYS